MGSTGNVGKRKRIQKVVFCEAESETWELDMTESGKGLQPICFSVLLS